MSDANLYRRKTAMLLFEIEESFGDFIKDKINDLTEIPDSVLVTLQERKLDIEIKSIDQAIERTYLSEIFQLASIATDSTSLNHLIKEIYKLASVYELYDIRNAVAHPNRSFPNYYWYRVAAFASDPLIASLGIQKIHRCLISAEEGIITDPPDEWLDSSSFEIKNNLPKYFEHDITGLIGREKENEKLIKLLTNPRVNTVAVVAPGGYGKTALVLDLLKNQVFNPKTSSYADAIIFISLKAESLTLSGIQKQTAPETIEQLKSELIRAAEITYEVPFDDFSECKDYLKDERLLICIDNLETLLRDNPEAFDELNLELPASWRVLVTSRTIISSNQSITLEPLGKKQSINLITSYISKKGGKSIGKDFCEKIAEDCYFNPLAIRLSIDKILNGSTIQTALSSTKSEIAEFSFRNLIESLSVNANSVLEALLLAGESEKIFLCTLLDFTLDELSNALRELIPTSLLSRKIYDSVELFDLSSSIRDLLLLDTRNIDLRESILAKKEHLERQANEVDKKQKELSVPIYSVKYIPKYTQQSLKILLEKFHRCNHTNPESISGVLKEFKAAYETFKNLDIFQREYARLSSFLKDYKTAVTHAKIATEINGDEPLNFYVLADCCFRAKDYAESANHYTKLLDVCKVNDIHDLRLLASAHHGLFQSLLWKGDYQLILQLTEYWQEQENFRALFGGYRSTAYKRNVENSLKANTHLYVMEMSKCINVMDQVFTIDGYLKSPCIQSLKIIDEIEHFVPRLHTEICWYEFCILGLNFLKNHYNGIIEQQSLEKNTDSKIASIFSVILMLKSLPIASNPLVDIGLEKSAPTNHEEINSAYVEVKVYHVMNDPNKKFARDKNGIQYYLTKENTSADLYLAWESISVGDKLFVIPDSPTEENKATPVLDILRL